MFQHKACFKVNKSFVFAIQNRMNVYAMNQKRFLKSADSP